MSDVTRRKRVVVIRNGRFRALRTSPFRAARLCCGVQLL